MSLSGKLSLAEINLSTWLETMIKCYKTIYKGLGKNRNQKKNKVLVKFQLKSDNDVDTIKRRISSLYHLLTKWTFSHLSNIKIKVKINDGLCLLDPSLWANSNHCNNNNNTQQQQQKKEAQVTFLCLHVNRWEERSKIFPGKLVQLLAGDACYSDLVWSL